MHSDLFAIQGYALLRQDRDLIATSKKTAGGLMTYIRPDSFPNFKLMDKLSVSNQHVETQWVKIIRDNATNIVLCNL